MPKIEVSLGEFIDKYTILQIKEERIKDEAKLKHIKVEIKSLLRNLNSDEEHLLSKTLPNELISELKTVNEKLWDTEDVIRKCERENKFDEEFV